MPIKALVQDLATVDEKYRGDYKPIAEGPKKGWFQFTVEPVEGFDLQDVAGLKSALSGERTKRGELENAVKAFEGLDAKEVRDLVAKRDKILAGDLDGKHEEQVKKRIADAKADLEKKILEQQDLLKRRDTQVQHLAVRSQAATVLAKLKGNPDLLMPHVERYARTIEDPNGGISVVILDEDGKSPRITRKSGTDPMGLEEFAETTLREKYPEAFGGTAPRGSGMSGGQGATAGSPHVITQSQARDVPTYRAATEAAAKAGVELQVVPG